MAQITVARNGKSFSQKAPSAINQDVLWVEWLAFSRSPRAQSAFLNISWTSGLMQAIHHPWPFNIIGWQRWWKEQYSQYGDVPPHLVHVPELMGEDDPSLAKLIPQTALAVYSGYANAQLMFRDIWQGVIQHLAEIIISIADSKQGEPVVVFDAGGGTGVKAILVFQKIQKLVGKTPPILWIVADRQETAFQVGAELIVKHLKMQAFKSLDEVQQGCPAVVQVQMDLFGTEASQYHGIADLVLSCEAMHGDNVVEGTPAWINMMTQFCKPDGHIVAIDMIRHRRVAWVIGFLANLGHVPFKFPLAQCNAGVSSELQSASRDEWETSISPQLPSWLKISFPAPGGIWNKVCKGNWFVMVEGVKP